MALTANLAAQGHGTGGVTGVPWEQRGRWKIAIANLTFTAADVYTTAGFAIDTAAKSGLGINRIEEVFFFGSSSTGTGNLSGQMYGRFNFSTGKVQLFQTGRATDNSVTAPSTEVTNGALLTAVSLPCIVIGT